MNDTPHIATSYASRVVAVRSELAQQAFDACRADRQYRSSVPSRWLVPASAHAVLVVHGAGEAELVPNELTLRRCPGVLQTGWRRRRIELELSPWSTTASQLGVRFLRGNVTRREHAAAAHVLDVLAAELELRSLLARHPDHVTGSERREVIASAWL